MDIHLFDKPIETAIQLGEKTYLTIYDRRKLHLVVLQDNKVLLRIAEEDFKKFNIIFQNDMISGIHDIDVTKLIYYLEKDSKDLFIRIRRELKRNFELSNMKDYDILTSWVIGTYLFTELNSFPYIHFHAPKGSGKSTVLQTLEKLCFNGQMLVDMTPAIARDIDGEKPTLLIDESEELYELRTKSERVMQLKKILNTGYQKGAKFPRHVLDKSTNKYRKEFFYVYCPKAFASIRELDPVLNDRCISINLIRSQKKFTLRTQELVELKHELFAYMIKNYGKILAESGKTNTQLEKHEIFGRQNEQFTPLLMVANHFNEDILEHLKKISQQKIDMENSIQSDEQVLIQALYNIFERTPKEQDFIGLEEIKNEMKAIYNDDCEWLKNYYLGQVMHRLGFKDTTRRGSTGRTFYQIDKLQVDKLVYAYNVQIDWEGRIPSTKNELKQELIPK